MAIIGAFLYANGGVINFSGSPTAETDIRITDKPYIAPNPNEEFTGYTGNGMSLVKHTDVTFTRDGYVFSEWNSSADGTGTSFAIGDTVTIASVYAIWEEAAVVVPNVTISYNGDTIASLSDSGTEVLETNGTYLTDDITIDYTKPTPNLQSKTTTPTTSSQTITADSGYDGLSQVTVNAISPTKAAQTYTPTTTNQTIASGRWLTGTQTIKGDANLVADNIKSGVSIFGVTGSYEGSGGGGAASFIQNHGTMTSYEDSTVTTIGKGAFAYCSSLANVSFPVCTSIESLAFNSCVSLTSVSFPVCTSIGSSAFYYCSSLTAVSFPSCTSIGGFAFFHCGSLANVSFPSCTSIGDYAFNTCSSLTAASFPVCTTIGQDAFYMCTNMSVASFPVCTTIKSNAFYSCIKMSVISFPSCTTIGGSAFINCVKLETASFPSCETIKARAF